VNFLVVDVPLAYNMILGCLKLQSIKVAIVPHLLLMQYELDNGAIGKLYKD